MDDMYDGLFRTLLIGLLIFVLPLLRKKVQVKGEHPVSDTTNSSELPLLYRGRLAEPKCTD